MGRHLVQNEQGECVTVNGNRYRAMLKKFLFTNIEEEDIGDLWFQQDDVTCHTAEATFDVLSPVLEDLFISRRANVVCPPQSCDLTPLDYYLWGTVKDTCYANKPETIDALKDNIREAVGAIPLHTIDNVLKNWTNRVDYCMASRGSHLDENIFSLLTGKIVLSNKKKEI